MIRTFSIVALASVLVFAFCNVLTRRQQGSPSQSKTAQQDHNRKVDATLQLHSGNPNEALVVREPTQDELTNSLTQEDSKRYLQLGMQAESQIPPNYRVARLWYEPTARIGVPDGMYRLGLLLRSGKGGKKDIVKAVELFVKAGNQGHKPSQRAWANCVSRCEYFIRGEILREDGLRFYKELVDQGDSTAAYELGMVYWRGVGLHVTYGADFSAAYEPLLIAANAGISKAQVLLGDAKQFGMGTPVDHKEAFNWYLRAAKKANSMAVYRLMQRIEGRSLSVDQKQSILDWQPTFDDPSLGSAALVKNYLISARGDLLQAEQLIGIAKDASHRGSPFAMLEWSSVLAEKEELASAREMLELAAAASFPPAQLKLATALYEGTFGYVDEVRADSYLGEAEDSCFLPAILYRANLQIREKKFGLASMSLRFARAYAENRDQRLMIENAIRFAEAAHESEMAARNYRDTRTLSYESPTLINMKQEFFLQQQFDLIRSWRDSKYNGPSGNYGER